MEGVGEVFGQCVDDVIRRPISALVPLLQDATLFGIVALAARGLPTLNLGPYHVGRDPEYPFAIPGALPSITDLFDVPRALVSPIGLSFIAAILLAVVTIVTLAYVEAGFIASLKRLYVDPRVARLDPGALLDEPSLADARRAFIHGATSRGAPLALFRLALGSVAFTAAYLSTILPDIDAGLTGVLVIEGFLVYAPYALVLDDVGPLGAARRSLRVASDKLATTLVMLLFLFATTGAVAGFVTVLNGFAGGLGVVLGAALYAVAGTVLSLFVLRVYLGIEGAVEATIPSLAPTDVARGTD